MAKETKVGLLAGLAFIICFAVILANRGVEDPAASRAPFLPDGRGAVPGSVQQSASRTAPHSPRAGGGNSRADGRDLGSTRSPDPRRTDQAPPAQTPGSGAELVFSDPGPATPRIATRRSNVPARADQPTARHRANARTDRGAGRAGRPTLQLPPNTAATTLSDVAETLPPRRRQTPDAAARQRELEQRLAAASGPTASDMSANAADAAAGNAPSRPNPQGRQSTGLPTAPARAEDTTARRSRADVAGRSGVSHTVVSGDTLSKIAAAHFGGKARRFVIAVFDANRTLLSDPDTIRVGMVLTIPVLEEVDGQPLAETNAAAPTPARRTAHARASEDGSRRPFRWYQIRKNDRYASIAREQLGSVGRWRELFELNKDKFPNPDAIREGVRIKIPLLQAVSP